MSFKLESPLFLASSTHFCSYPLPLNIILLCLLYLSFTRAIITSLTDLFFNSFSKYSPYSFNISATIVFSTNIGVAGEALEPGILNSNLFPVKAIGEVLFLSEISLGILEIFLSTVISLRCELELLLKFTLSIFSKISSNCSPKNIEIIAGGASCPPNL